MMNMYNVSLKHKILEANYNLYVNGICHANRVMQFHDFIYLLEGEWEIYQNDEKYTLYPDNILILQANQHHYGKKACHPNTKTMFLHVTSEHGDGFISDKANSDCIYTKILTDCKKNKNVKELFKEIIKEKWMNSRQSDIRMSALFDLLLCEISIASSTENPDIIHIFNDALTLIRSSPNMFFTVSELADNLCVSDKTLQNIIKKYTGLTVHKYQIEKKLELAALQLQLHPDIKVRELSLNLGFYDEFHLSKLFKNKYQKSIRDYKNEIKNNDINNCKY